MQLMLPGGDAKKICNGLGLNRASALPMFHSLTGCDTVSSFAGIGKVTAWGAWMSYPQVTDAFLEISKCPEEIPVECKVIIERVVVLMYSKTSEQVEVNKARRELFTHKNRDLVNIPPTEAAFSQHIRRALYKAGHCWSQTLCPIPELPNPSDWGWVKKDNIWEPLWTTVSEASKACRELISCGCKKGCKSSLCGCKRSS